uniref:Uncharacterized protein n=1 Tax=Anguilla anguilla TaxID=7936 RepID=A0A0E9X106_ANGAN
MNISPYSYSKLSHHNFFTCSNDYVRTSCNEQILHFPCMEILYRYEPLLLKITLLYNCQFGVIRFIAGKLNACIL